MTLNLPYTMYRPAHGGGGHASWGNGHGHATWGHGKAGTREEIGITEETGDITAGATPDLQPGP